MGERGHQGHGVPPCTEVIHVLRMDVQQRTLAEEPPFEEETCRFGRVELSKDLVKAITQRHGVH